MFVSILLYLEEKICCKISLKSKCLDLVKEKMLCTGMLNEL